tara:strand:- start:176 stop:487 length:312 start_codon:yes stop_codon:yes gene_type:complete
MEPLSRVTTATIDVLSVLLAESTATWGLRVVAESGRPAGTVYPILERLERLGWVASEWEAETERSGPRRRLYSFTADGAAAAQSAVASHRRRATGPSARGALA